jgi:lipoic acid synthetase
MVLEHMDTTQEIQKVKKPDWLRVKLPTGQEYVKVRGIVSQHKLHTICESGNDLRKYLYP